MKFVKFTRDCLALSEHRAAGTIAQLPEATCKELIVEGAAHYVEAPAKDEKPSKKTKDSE
jgi:hypothetical protein